MSATSRQYAPQVVKLYTFSIFIGDNFDRWNRYLRAQFLNKVPQNFQVEIVHYDSMRIKTQAEIEVLKLEEVSLDHRIIGCEVVQDFVLLEVERLFRTQDHRRLSHIFLDLLGVFTYTEMLNVNSNGRPYGIQSICIGNEPRSELLAKSYFIMIDQDSGLISTYIDRMIECGFSFDRARPWSFIFNLLDRAQIDPRLHEIGLQFLMNQLMTLNLTPEQLIANLIKFISEIKK